MAFSTITIANDWPESPHYTASGETDVAVRGDGTEELVYCTTASDTAPTLDTFLAIPIVAAKAAALTLNDGERLWVAAPGLQSGSIAGAIHY